MTGEQRFYVTVSIRICLYYEPSILHTLGSGPNIEDASNETISVNFELESDCTMAVSGGHSERRHHWKQRSPHFCLNLKLLLSKGSVFVVGAMLVVAAGVASQYHPPDNIINGNYSNCSSNFSTGEVLDSSTISGTYHFRTTDSHKDHTACSTAFSSSFETKTTSTSCSINNIITNGIPLPSPVHQTIMSTIPLSPLS